MKEENKFSTAGSSLVNDVVTRRTKMERKKNHGLLSYIEDITRWREDMNFMFEWQEQYLTRERSERVRESIKFISSS